MSDDLDKAVQEALVRLTEHALMQIGKTDNDKEAFLKANTKLGTEQVVFETEK